MTPIEVVLIWGRSLVLFLSTMDVEVAVSVSGSGRLNNSCAINASRGSMEAELLLWESGEAELALVDRGGQVIQEHFESLDPPELEAVLSRMLMVFTEE